MKLTDRNLDIRDYFLFALTAKTARNIVNNYNKTDYYISFDNIDRACISMANETLINRQDSNGVGKYIPSEPMTLDAYATALNYDNKYFWFDNNGVIVITDFMDMVAQKLNEENRMDVEKIKEKPMSILYDVKQTCEELGVSKLEKDLKYSDFLIDVVNTVLGGEESSNPVLGDE